MAVDQTSETSENFEGPVFVSFKQVKNTVSPARYRMLVGNFNFMTADSGNQGVSVQLKYDPNAHKEYEKRSFTERFWLTPAAINQYLSFLQACKISPEMLREEPIDPPQFNPDGSPVTACVHSVEEQLRSIFGAAVMVDVEEESYEGKAADGVTPEIRWRNKAAFRGFSKV